MILKKKKGKGWWVTTVKNRIRIHLLTLLLWFNVWTKLLLLQSLIWCIF
jgi:hypothetical protein